MRLLGQASESATAPRRDVPIIRQNLPPKMKFRVNPQKRSDPYNPSSQSGGLATLRTRTTPDQLERGFVGQIAL